MGSITNEPPANLASASFFLLYSFLEVAAPEGPVPSEVIAPAIPDTTDASFLSFFFFYPFFLLGYLLSLI